MKYLFLAAVLFCGLAHADAPRCNPGDYSPTVNWQVGVSSDQSIVSILWCNDSIGLEWWAAGWNPAQAPVNACAGNVQTQSVTLLLAAFWSSCLASGGTLTSAQQTAVNDLLRLWMPQLQTPEDGRAVYQYANGKLVGSMEGRIVAHALCKDVVVATLNKMDFYDVSGQQFTDGTVIPPNSAAVCRLVTPPAGGW